MSKLYLLIKILCIIGAACFGMSALIFTISTYMWAFSPYTSKMFECMGYNVLSITGCILGVWCYFKLDKGR